MPLISLFFFRMYEIYKKFSLTSKFDCFRMTRMQTDRPAGGVAPQVGLGEKGAGLQEGDAHLADAPVTQDHPHPPSPAQETEIL